MSTGKQQEMAERSDKSSTGFWRSRPSAAARAPSQDYSKVIGASYSYTDMLNFGNMSVSGSRPRTPPKSSSLMPTDSPPQRPRGFISTPPRKSYNRFFSESTSSWDSHRELDVEDEDAVNLGEDEDEFGLPSLAGSYRQPTKRKTTSNSTTNLAKSISNKSAAGSEANLWRTDSGDISDTRGLPSYPIAKPSEGKILRPQYKDVLRDPANYLHLISHPPIPIGSTTKEADAYSARITRINKFKRLLQSSSISLSDLRSSAWSGLPEEVRAMTWQVLLGYLPTSAERRVATLERKRKEYLDGVKQAFERGGNTAAAGSGSIRGKARGLDEAIWHQISIDVPRTNPHLELYSYEATQRSLERILYVWAIRHPASGYVQGINDLVTPFFQVFLAQYITGSNIETGMDPGQLPKAVLDAVEADSFWCLSKLLDGIQDNYVHAQPGIVRQVASLRELTKRIDAGLVNHMEDEGIEFMQFSFRWMNCLLMREISVQNTIRMWDTYLSEEQGFTEFHLYVCAAFLVKWTEQLLKMDFQETMMFLQALPTRSWNEKDIELLLSEAYIWQSLYKGSTAHLRDSDSPRPSAW